MQPEIRFEPTLFVFLGTSSAQVGWRLKELLRKAYGDVPILRFLWVDADSTVDPYVSSWFLPEERAEFRRSVRRWRDQLEDRTTPTTGPTTPKEPS